jgi:hypothetical protein
MIFSNARRFLVVSLVYIHYAGAGCESYTKPTTIAGPFQSSFSASMKPVEALERLP